MLTDVVFGQDVVAEVIDSVLYSSSDTQTVDFGTPAPVNPLTLDARRQGSNAVFDWDNFSGITSVYKASDNSVLCSGSNASDNDCSVAIASAPVGTSVYAKDSSGKQSSTVTVSGP